MEAENTHGDIEEVFENPDGAKEFLETATKKPRRVATEINPVGLSMYGPKFKKYMKIDEVRDLIPAFKEYYYTRRVAEPKATLVSILREFNQHIESMERLFHPYTKQVKIWTTKWDKDILEQRGMALADEKITPERRVQQVLKTRRSTDNGVVEYNVPSYELIEGGLQTLGGELLNDAMQMIREDQENEDVYASDELMKRKNYVTNVFAHVTKMVHGKASLLLKASAEKRENVSFLMDLMKRATAGEVNEEEIASLKETYKPQPTTDVSA